MNATGLVRLTVAAPTRRVDLALPARAPLAELLPALLARAGEEPPAASAHASADAAGGDGDGWVLRRVDGTPLEPARTLAAYQVRDGEVLHLTRGRTEWPELEYDDVVDAIATGSAGTGGTWRPRHTRRVGLAIGVLAVLLCLVAVLRAGPAWSGPAWWALGVAGLLVCAGVLLARVAGDSGAGAVCALAALPLAAAGGGLLLAGDRALTALGAPHLLAAGALLLVASVAGLLGVVDRAAVFVGGATVGVLGIAVAWLATLSALAGHEAAAIVASVGLVLSPAIAPLSIRLGRVPMPVLPRTAADLVRDEPQPPRAAVYAAVLRADALLSGMVGGLAAVTAGCLVLLVRHGGLAASVLVSVVSVGLLLRARLYPIARQRAPLLAAGLTGVVCLAAGPLMADRADLLVVTAPGLLLTGAIVALLAVRYGVRRPGPYLSRYAELLEVVVVLAVVPVACWVLGLYGYVRGLGG
ncbi:type VII secretion integral membrane protein EccD [Micromonospora sp. NBC_01813]|uniref:type VII secretion integral membrane protein EccD n=1 Tax=Micromonospora sp. NBC_01813 TaxID=2975988 RepID=UPI002DDC0851|nr:type VII secretion integral membrane protein EccD [Micromonospora sp. NBC_01813]WSA06279.1 type VII secretion integral membrane protein EccD [Micromonospora sp. NBC_01813]